MPRQAGQGGTRLRPPARPQAARRVLVNRAAGRRLGAKALCPLAPGGSAGFARSCCLARGKVEQREEDRRGLRDASEGEREALGRPVMEICPMTRLALSTSPT